jgi:hypothetical protein
LTTRYNGLLVAEGRKEGRRAYCSYKISLGGLQEGFLRQASIEVRLQIFSNFKRDYSESEECSIQAPCPNPKSNFNLTPSLWKRRLNKVEISPPPQ